MHRAPHVRRCTRASIACKLFSQTKKTPVSFESERWAAAAQHILTGYSLPCWVGGPVGPPLTCRLALSSEARPLDEGGRRGWGEDDEGGGRGRTTTEDDEDDEGG